jgi:hypothetical protein
MNLKIRLLVLMILPVVLGLAMTIGGIAQYPNDIFVKVVGVLVVTLGCVGAVGVLLLFPKSSRLSRRQRDVQTTEGKLYNLTLANGTEIVAVPILKGGFVMRHKDGPRFDARQVTTIAESTQAQISGAAPSHDTPN